MTDRNRGGGGGLALLIRQSVKYTPVDTAPFNDGKTEVQAIIATLNGVKTHVFNVYVPPSSSLPTGYSPARVIDNLLNLSGDASLICGDFNAHDAMWFSSLSDSRGADLAEVFEESNFCILNGNFPTRACPATSPDITLASPNLANLVSWRTAVKLNSDHYPIFVDFLVDTDARDLPRRMFTNYARADWGAFKEESERTFSQLPRPSSCSKGEKIFRKTLLTAASHSIPAGCRSNFTPGLSSEASGLCDERDDLRDVDPDSPEIAAYNVRIADVVNEEKRKEWLEKLANADHQTNVGVFWGLLRLLVGKSTGGQDPNQPIKFGEKYFTEHSKIANKFTRQYTSIGPHKYDRRARKVNRRIRRMNKLGGVAPVITVDQVVDAIRKTKNSKAEGPDGLTILHLKNLGPLALNYLTVLFNLSVKHSNIPAIWKSAIILPLLKPGKPADVSTSYRPISLLSP